MFNVRLIFMQSLNIKEWKLLELQITRNRITALEKKVHNRITALKNVRAESPP